MYWVTGILGLALILAPFVLGYNDNVGALWSSLILGAVMALVSGYKAAARDAATWEYGVVVIAGLLAVIAPFVLGFSAVGVAVWSSIILGAAAAFLAGYRLLAQPQAR
ncbi:MAG: SPW repeat protein [Ardenticatenaceae bacterium]|nr:SPW repeat protein [Ardenticatenaceae bacterium]HBY96727.1 hypothetical protein [Chloroflexota bacterium]